ncbi:receptor protein 9DC3 [Trifolium repens]|nr:receptor protein 9DC3 [Trifolium repens]
MAWLLLCIHFPSFSSPSSSFNFLCHHDESSSLLQFISSFTIRTYCDEPTSKTATWINGTDCCSWNGVTCDTINGHVTGLKSQPWL